MTIQVRGSIFYLKFSLYNVCDTGILAVGSPLKANR